MLLLYLLECRSSSVMAVELVVALRERLTRGAAEEVSEGEVVGCIGLHLFAAYLRPNVLSSIAVVIRHVARMNLQKEWRKTVKK